jgi:hypothetical protein
MTLVIRTNEKVLARMRGNLLPYLVLLTPIEEYIMRRMAGLPVPSYLEELYGVKEEVLLERAFWNALIFVNGLRNRSHPSF